MDVSGTEEEEEGGRAELVMEGSGRCCWSYSCPLVRGVCASATRTRTKLPDAATFCLPHLLELCLMPTPEFPSTATVS